MNESVRSLDVLLEIARDARIRAENARIQALEATQALGTLVHQLDRLATMAREQAKS